MANSNFYDKVLTLPAADYVYGPMDCEHFTAVSVQVSWVDQDKLDGSVTPSWSNDGVNYKDGTPVAIDGEPDMAFLTLANPFPYRFLKITIDNGTNTTGTYDIGVMAKTP